MCLQLNELDLKDIKTLKEQLTGVDSAYFSMFLDVLENQPDVINKGNNYLCNVIDKIFEGEVDE